MVAGIWSSYSSYLRLKLIYEKRKILLIVLFLKFKYRYNIWNTMLQVHFVARHGVAISTVYMAVGTVCRVVRCRYIYSLHYIAGHYHRFSFNQTASAGDQCASIRDNKDRGTPQRHN